MTHHRQEQDRLVDRIQQSNRPGSIPAQTDAVSSALSRRSFLETAGFSLSIAALSGCGRAPQRLSLPFPEQPAEVIPGVSKNYASTCHGCPAGCGLLVKVRDGRPLKMEGMPEHPLSKGGLCATGQALPLELYDSFRLKHPIYKGAPATWEDLDRKIGLEIEAIKANKLAVRFVTPTITSPTTKEEIRRFLGEFTDGKHLMFDPVSSSAILDAHLETHGRRVLPHYDFAAAKVIVACGADFLGTWISPVEFTAGWSSRRRPTTTTPEMSYHVQLEGRLSLTGTKADRRYRVSPLEFGMVLSEIASRIAARAGVSFPHVEYKHRPLPEEAIEDLASRLWAAQAESLVICDSQDVATQTVVNFINYTLKNYGKTLDINRSSLQRQGDDRSVQELLEELESGKVGALFVAGIDLNYSLSDRESLSSAIQKTRMVVSFAERQNEIASVSHFVCPDHHPLETWLDAEPVVGTLSLSQPTIQPLAQTRSLLESLARWRGRQESSYELIREHWKTKVFPEGPGESFDALWDRAVHDGVYLRTNLSETTAGDFRPEGVRAAQESIITDGFTLELYPRIGLTDSRHAHNPWLQELPDPITKIVWDNYASLSPRTAEQLQVRDGDVVSIEDRNSKLRVELPIVSQVGQADSVIAVALGYGVRGTDRFAQVGPRWLEAKPTVGPGELVGKNVSGFLRHLDGEFISCLPGVTVIKTDRSVLLASTQMHHSLEIPRNVAPHGAEVRDIVQETTLEKFVKNPKAGETEVHHSSTGDLWPEDHPKRQHRWGMIIDQNACTGCSACLISCQSENNVPVVGKDEVRRQREMHWIRIDRYYAGVEDHLRVAHQPMMCQHCENAPCETVCPALATTHSDEGLNEQVYNRCVGTRYCANNCPYKVRRFNWFGYDHHDAVQNLALNPDVTVRTRGVMEKCSMCAQRIEEGKIASRQHGRTISDGDIQTACQQSCPSQAIIFGDLNDPNSRVHAAMQDPRRYGILEEYNFKTSVKYLRIVRNDPFGDQESSEHG